MKVAFLIQNYDNPSGRFRIRECLPHLKDFGLDYKLFCAKPHLYAKKNKIFKLFFASIRCINNIRLLIYLNFSRKYSVIFINRFIPPLLPIFPFELLLKLSNKKIVVDYDDAVYRINKKSYSRILKIADLVITGNDFLKDFALKHNSNVITIPTSVDVDIYTFVSPRDYDKEEIVIGWIGRTANLVCLSQVLEPLQKIAKQYNIIFKVISNFQDEKQMIHISGVKVTNKTWVFENEINDIRSFDIGLMPLFNDEPSKGKCAFKAIQCMAMGVPVVISNIGANSVLVDDGVNGFLFETPEDFVVKIIRLINDTALRRSFAKNARLKILQFYNTRKNSHIIVTKIKELFQLS